MKIKRQVLREFSAPYAVNIHRIGGREKVVFAAELDSLCVGVWADTLEQEALWEGQGGTMNTFQLNEKGDFLAIQRFYRGFQCGMPALSRRRNRKINGSRPKSRTCPFATACVWWKSRAFPTWCAAFCVRIRKIPKTGPSRAVWWCRKFPGRRGNRFPLPRLWRESIKSWYFPGTLDGKNTILVTGQEGIFQLEIPAGLDDPWSYTKLMDQETSDCTVLDVDEDGEDEIIAIEKFHGNRVVVYKRQGRDMEAGIYLSGGIWPRYLERHDFSRPAFLIGYRAANAALLLFRLKEKREGRC